MTIKIFRCGLCNVKKSKVYVGTRAGLRKHIREFHWILSEIANTKHDKNDVGVPTRQRWWITEECKYGM